MIETVLYRCDYSLTTWCDDASKEPPYYKFESVVLVLVKPFELRFANIQLPIPLIKLQTIAVI